MTRLSFSVVGASVDEFAAAPMLTLRVRIGEDSGARIDAIALNVQVRIEPQYRRYDGDEPGRLLDLFGPPARYGETLRPMLWTHVAQTVLAFSGEKEIDLHIPCSYDFDVAANKYLSALEAGEIPINLLFSGTAFVESEGHAVAERVSWDCEARYRLPVVLWRRAMDAFFPNAAWIRLSRDAFEELCRYKAARSLPTWDAVLLQLLDGVSARTPR